MVPLKKLGGGDANDNWFAGRIVDVVGVEATQYDEESLPNWSAMESKTSNLCSTYFCPVDCGGIESYLGGGPSCI